MESLHCITVTFIVREQHAQAFVLAVRANARQSLTDEPGCRLFDVCVDAGGQRVFLYELYDNEAAFKAHLATPHFKAFDAKVAPWVVDKQVQAWQRLA